MLRRLAALTMTVAWACSGVRPTDPPAAAGSIAPRLSAYGDRIVLSWVERDAAGVPTLKFAPREAGGWGAPASVIRDPALAADSADIPSVVPLRDGGLAAHWTLKRNKSSHARDLLAALSKDNGRSWSAPVRPHRDDTESEHGMATIVPGELGDAFGIGWLDGRAGEQSEYGEGGTSLYWAEWNGDGFDPEVLLDPRVCDCCKTSAARGPSGPLVAFRDRAEGERRDIAIVRRVGTVWSQPQPVHADGWSLSACPTNGPSITAREERAAVAWFTGADAKPSVWVAFSSDGGKTLGTPARVDGGAPVGRVEAAMLADGSTAVVWLERKGEAAEIRVRRVRADGGLTDHVVVATTSPARASGYPTIAAEGPASVLVAWIDTTSPGRVRAAVVPLR
jgi:hypothetical protein